MLKRIIIILLSFQLCFASAMVVSDPVSYTHYIEQINEFKKQVDLMTKQIETLGGIKTATDDVKRQIYTVKEQFNDTMMAMMKAGERMGEALANTKDNVKKLGSYRKDSITTTQSDGGYLYEDTAKLIDAFFETTNTMDAAKFFHLNDAQLRKSLKNDTQQMTYYKIIDDYDFLEKSLIDTNKIVDDIMNKMYHDGEPSMIEMQKITNMLLQNMIVLQSQSLKLQNDLAFAMSLEKYTGVNHEDFKKRINALEDENIDRKQNFLEDNKAKTKSLDRINSDYNINHMYGY
ncbi:hypothetical protein FE243_07085 [Aliarcobacter thereius]|uniref:Type IV secretion system protein n=1 Tax=Aliarcobacter thereius TaxID=544718 RepID=A0A5R9H533_9BACT|nr:hypothetical protein [Aliarcobacter thereius]TLS71053.1 hypothetical protein FE246_08810 [Aliarcobacter thereius]TLT06657.1 hypothetical protein FE243_07085 [Aliarcobacter thereius]